MWCGAQGDKSTHCLPLLPTSYLPTDVTLCIGTVLLSNAPKSLLLASGRVNESLASAANPPHSVVLQNVVRTHSADRFDDRFDSLCIGGVGDEQCVRCVNNDDVFDADDGDEP